MTRAALSIQLARWLMRWRPTRRIVDWLLVITLSAIIGMLVVFEAGAINGDVLFHFALTLLVIIPLLWRRTHQPASFIASLAALIAGEVFGETGLALPVLLFAVYAIARYSSLRHSVGAAAAAYVYVLSLEWIFAGWTWSNLAIASPPIVAWLVGERVQYRSGQKAALYERIDDLEFDRTSKARKAVVEERLRFARELHDVVSHSISAVALMAGGARTSTVEMSPDAREMFATIEQTARQELAEIRQLLRALRTDGDPADVGPSVHLCDIGALAQRHQVDGFTVTVTYLGEPRVVSANVELAGYRIIHEALFNARRHGDADQATVEIDFTDDCICVTVADNGTTATSSTGGLGLVGMRERAELLNGTFNAGRSDVGWKVVAEIPLRPDERANSDRTGD